MSYCEWGTYLNIIMKDRIELMSNDDVQNVFNLANFLDKVFLMRRSYTATSTEKSHIVYYAFQSVFFYNL